MEVRKGYYSARKDAYGWVDAVLKKCANDSVELDLEHFEYQIDKNFGGTGKKGILDYMKRELKFNYFGILEIVDNRIVPVKRDRVQQLDTEEQDD